MHHKTSHEPKMYKKMAARKKLDLLTAMERIVEKAKGTGLSSEFYRKADRYIKYVSDRLEMTREQAVMMALFIDNCDNSNIRISDICSYLECRTTKIIKCMSDIDMLEKRGFVRCCRNEKISYRVPVEVVEAFKKDEKYMPKDYSGMTCMELFGELSEIFEARDDQELTYEATLEKVMNLLSYNQQLHYVQKVKSYNFDESDTMMLILFYHLFVNNHDDDIRYSDLRFLFEIRRDWNYIKSMLNNGDYILQTEGFIEFNNDNGFVDRESFRMTDKAKGELFTELNLCVKKRHGDMVRCEKILPKKLFYGEKFGAQIAELKQLLDNEHYNQIRTRMKESGFRCGFTCLFYGAPGTGKTETVLQIARQTGRDILQVNISQIKSMWVGESEKNIKHVFDNYRALVKEYDITPILLFNEADAIIGKRQEGADRAVEKMENSIQNIILQEMETLDGILIATTNLAQNMDKAFERRFLYKVKFENPTLEARMNMWHEMIPILNDMQSRLLATKYEFSGGQIENIARHYTIGNILHGNSDNLIEELEAYCDNEKLESKRIRRIGFC